MESSAPVMVSKKSSCHGPKITAREGDGGHKIADESSGCTFLSAEENNRCSVVSLRSVGLGSTCVPDGWLPS